MRIAMRLGVWISKRGVEMGCVFSYRRWLPLFFFTRESLCWTWFQGLQSRDPPGFSACDWDTKYPGRKILQRRTITIPVSRNKINKQKNCKTSFWNNIILEIKTIKILIRKILKDFMEGSKKKNDEKTNCTNTKWMFVS